MHSYVAIAFDSMLERQRQMSALAVDLDLGLRREVFEVAKSHTSDSDDAVELFVAIMDKLEEIRKAYGDARLHELLYSSESQSIEQIALDYGVIS